MKHQADLLAQLDDVGIRRVDVLAVQQHFPLHLRVGNLVVHAVETAQESGFAAARRPDESGDFVTADVHGNIEERLLGPVEKAQVLDFDGDVFFVAGRFMFLFPFGHGAKYTAIPLRSQRVCRERSRELS